MKHSSTEVPEIRDLVFDHDDLIEIIRPLFVTLFSNANITEAGQFDLIEERAKLIK